MGIHKRILNNDPSKVSMRFSGKGKDGKPLEGHRHAFYLPYDEDGDGRLDHLIVYSAAPFDSEELKAIDSLRSVWQPNARPDVNCVLVRLSPALDTQASQWVSATPFVTSRHYRKGRGTYVEWLNNEVIKECSFHGLPKPVNIEWIPSTIHTAHPVRWMEFQRNRKGRTSFRGYGCLLAFDESVIGPFALGAGCHYGLGLFVPYAESPRTYSGS